MQIDELLEDIPDKRENKGTTSLRFKRDLIDFFQKKNKNKGTLVELGTHNGFSTKVLSHLFQNVATFDNNYENTCKAKCFNQEVDNITYHIEDVYEYDWWKVSNDISAVFVDTVHTYEKVVLDIENCLKIENECYIIFDDYGLFEEVKKAVDEYTENKKIEFVKYIGEPKGSDCRVGKTLQDWEGIVCKKNKNETKGDF